MYDDADNERDFWQDEPTRRLSRVPLRPAAPRPAAHRPAADRTRQHIPVITTPDRPARRPLDPFLKRLGLIVCVGVAMMPIAYTLRHGASDMFQTAPTGGAAAVPVLNESVGSLVTAPVLADGLLADVAPSVHPVDTVSVAQSPATTEFDIDALPPATPVNTVAAPVTAPVSVAAQAQGAPTSTKAATAAVTTPATVATTSAPKVQATAALVCSKSYGVVAGDYWILIAQKVGVTTKDLLAANAATTATPLFPGRDICLPKTASTPSTAAPAPAATTAAAPATTKPVPTTVAPTTVPRRVYSAAEVEAIIREVWPDELEDEAVRIARRESNLQPTARNSCCYGLFQIYWSVHKGWLAQQGITAAEQLFDPEVASKAGLALYHRSGGWGPWAI